MKMKGKSALITGGGSGINLAIAKRFASEGARVALVGRTLEKLERAAAEIRELGGSATVHPADVRDYEALAGAIASAAEENGRIDFVVCGAAGNFPAPALGMSANGFRAVIDIDLLGTVQHVPGGVRTPEPARRQHHKHFGDARLQADRSSGARVRGESRRGHADKVSGTRVGGAGRARQLDRAGSGG
jgi:NAD(P)-dependent dehydrogenase (short-subunit alcohol dehydrogenase family)